MRACWICSQSHWDNKRIFGPVPFPTDECAHREAELIPRIQRGIGPKSSREAIGGTDAPERSYSHNRNFPC